jgi:hypothetical protein
VRVGRGVALGRGVRVACCCDTPIIATAIVLIGWPTCPADRSRRFEIVSPASPANITSSPMTSQLTGCIRAINGRACLVVVDK